MKRNSYVLVYNPISNEGHLDSWHVLFVDLLRQDGWRVIAVSTDPRGLRAKLVAKGLEVSDALIVFESKQHNASQPSLIRQTWHALNTAYDKVRYQIQDHTSSKTLAQYGHRLGVLAAYRLVEVAHRAYRSLRQSRQAKQSPSQAQTQTESVLHPALFADAVNEVVAQYPGQVRHVLNMYIDAYRTDQDAWRDVDFSETIPWSALCITPGAEPVEAYYQQPSYRGTCFLDELVCEHYQEVRPDRYFEYLPDVADVELPATHTALTRQIVAQAAGRKIVFLGGSIGKQKNLEIWFDVIRRMDPGAWYFVQIGRINRNNLTASDQRALDATVADRPANLFIYPDYLPDERHFNDVMAAADVVFAVYRDFKRSSNMLSKAAYFEKPILVSAAYLMGERVSRYKIGLAVEEDSVDSICDGLAQLGAIPALVDNFEAYRQDFNLDVARQRLSRFIRFGLER